MPFKEGIMKRIFLIIWLVSGLLTLGMGTVYAGNKKPNINKPKILCKKCHNRQIMKMGKEAFKKAIEKIIKEAGISISGSRQPSGGASISGNRQKPFDTSISGKRQKLYHW